MPPRSRHAAAATALRVAAITWILSTWSLCACAPAGDAGAAAASAATEDDGLYRPPPPGEDGAYVPEAEDQQVGDDAGAYIPEKYETDVSAGEGTYDAKKYESVEGFDNGMYHPQPDLEEHDDGSYHPEISERMVGDDGSYRAESDGGLEGENGSYRPEEYEKNEGDDGSYNPQLYEAVVGDEGAYNPDIAEKVVGDNGLYHPDTSIQSEDREGDYNPEIYEKVVGDDGSYHGTEEDDGSYHPNADDLHQEGLYSEDEVQKVAETTLNGAAQLQAGVPSPIVDVSRQTPVTRTRRQQSDGTFKYKAVTDDSPGGSVTHNKTQDPEVNGGTLVKPVADKTSATEAHSDVYRLQTLEEQTQQGDDGAYHPERYETPAPEEALGSERALTEGSVTSDDGSATPSDETSEASDDGSYRLEHHKTEDYDERADSGQESMTPAVEPTEAADDGSYRAEHHTETPAEDYDEKADNGTDWRDNVVDQHEEGTEPADDGSYRPLEHGPRERRGASEDREEVQLSPVVFHVGPKAGADVTSKASGSVSDDDAHATPAQPADHQVHAVAA